MCEGFCSLQSELLFVLAVFTQRIWATEKLTLYYSLVTVLLLTSSVQKEMMAPTVKGTMNVLEACSATKVQKIILVSSLASVSFDPSWPEDKLIDESCWSDKDFCKQSNAIMFTTSLFTHQKLPFYQNLHVHYWKV